MVTNGMCKPYTNSQQLIVVQVKTYNFSSSILTAAIVYYVYKCRVLLN
jgi:spore coat protein CotF